MSTSQKLLPLAILIGIALRIFFAWQYPFTNDEGAYLFDAKLLTQGRLPGGDVLAKSPIPALLFSLSVWLTQGSLFAARLVSIFASVATLLPLAWIVYRMMGKQAAIMAAWLWLLVTPISMQVLGITEPIANFFAVISLALWWEAVTPYQSRYRSWQLAAMAGVALALAYASRKTTIAVLFPVLYLWLFAPRQGRTQAAMSAITGLASIIFLWVTVTYYLYGSAGVSEALGVSYGSIWQAEASTIAGRDGGMWAGKVLVTAGSGLVIAATIGLAWAATKLYQKKIIPAFPLVWIVALGGLYAGWPTFLPEYFIDFFIPATMLAALALTDMWQRWPRRSVGIIVIILLASMGSIWNSLSTPWTGMFSKEAIRAAATTLQAQVPRYEPIFTAAVIIPYVSGHDVMLDVTHPLWYRYNFIPDSIKETFLPPQSVVEHEIQYGKTRWALIEHLTDYAYLRSEAHLIALFGQQWQLAETTPNNTGYRSNPLKLYKRGR